MNARFYDLYKFLVRNRLLIFCTKSLGLGVVLLNCLLKRLVALISLLGAGHFDDAGILFDELSKLSGKFHYFHDFSPWILIKFI